MTYNETYALLEYLEQKGFLAGSLTAQLIMPTLAHDDELRPITLRVRTPNIPEWKEPKGA